MFTHQKSFSLIELMTIVAIIAIVASIAIAGVLRAKIFSNETSAISTLRATSTAQAEIALAVLKDRDGDGRGEFGYYTELGGVLSIPTNGTAGAVVTPSLISSALGLTSRDNFGVANKAGYHFQMYLPAATSPTANAIAETGSLVPVVAPTDEANNQELRWATYAWPAASGKTGNRAFFIDHSLNIIGTSNQYLGTNLFAYSGVDKPEIGDIYNSTTSNLDKDPFLNAATTAGSIVGIGLLWQHFKE